MPTKKQVNESLESVIEPATKRNIIGLNLVRDISIHNGSVKVTLASTGLIIRAQDWVKTKTKEAIAKLPGVKDVTIDYTDVKAKDLNTVDHVLAVMSGKGGVGKSLVSSLIAIALKRQGYEVGILDADITGPSIPKMFGLRVITSGNENAILPVLSNTGIEIMSINLILPNEDDAVIWRGPLIGRAITQFWEEVLWGKLDYLIVDLPPGTADAPLTVMQSLPISGIIIVFTPQDLTSMVVRKAVNMTQKMEKKILGVVENMSYLYVPEINKKIELFGRSRGEEMARTASAPLLGQLPIDPELAKLCDEGNIELYNSEIYNTFVHNLNEALQNSNK
jgi:Mrp family chromosome partitioning ATPase